MERLFKWAKGLEGREREGDELQITEARRWSSGRRLLLCLRFQTLTAALLSSSCKSVRFTSFSLSPQCSVAQSLVRLTDHSSRNRGWPSGFRNLSLQSEAEKSLPRPAAAAGVKFSGARAPRPQKALLNCD